MDTVPGIVNCKLVNKIYVCIIYSMSNQSGLLLQNCWSIYNFCMTDVHLYIRAQFHYYHASSGKCVKIHLQCSIKKFGGHYLIYPNSYWDSQLYLSLRQMSTLWHDAAYFVSCKELRACPVILSIRTNAVSALNETTPMCA